MGVYLVDVSDGKCVKVFKIIELNLFLLYTIVDEFIGKHHQQSRFSATPYSRNDLDNILVFQVSQLLHVLLAFYEVLFSHILFFAKLLLFFECAVVLTVFVSVFLQKWSNLTFF